MLSTVIMAELIGSIVGRSYCILGIRLSLSFGGWSGSVGGEQGWHGEV